MEIIDKLKTIIETKKIPITRIAEKSGFSRQHIARILKGETNVGIESLDAICVACGIDMRELYLEDLKHGLGFRIPVLGTVPAGIPIEAIEDILDYEEITPAMARTGDYFALKVKGNSMLPKILEGDVLIVRKQDDANSGDICVVMVNGNDATVKKIQKEADGIRLIPNNPEFDTVFYTSKQIEDLPVKVIGKAVEIRRGL